MLNRYDRPSPMAGEAEVKFLDGDFRIVRPGAFVRCAVTGVPIPLEELKYWSVDLQEAYASPEAVMRRLQSEAARKLDPAVARGMAVPAPNIRGSCGLLRDRERHRQRARRAGQRREHRPRPASRARSFSVVTRTSPSRSARAIRSRASPRR